MLLYIEYRDYQNKKDFLKKEKYLYFFTKKTPFAWGQFKGENNLRNCVNLNFESVKKLLNLNIIYKKQDLCHFIRNKIMLNNE